MKATAHLLTSISMSKLIPLFGRDEVILEESVVESMELLLPEFCIVHGLGEGLPQVIGGLSGLCYAS